MQNWMKNRNKQEKQASDQPEMNRNAFRNQIKHSKPLFKLITPLNIYRNALGELNSSGFMLFLSRVSGSHWRRSNVIPQSVLYQHSRNFPFMILGENIRRSHYVLRAIANGDKSRKKKCAKNWWVFT